VRVLQNRRHVFQRDFEMRGRLVDEVDGFVRQKSVGDVATGKIDRRDNRFVGDAARRGRARIFFQSAQKW